MRWMNRLGISLAATASACASTAVVPRVYDAPRVHAVGAPSEETVDVGFGVDADLEKWRIAAGSWRVKKEYAYGSQRGDESAYLTWPTYYGAISSVTIRGGIEGKENRNFRVAVGHVSAIFNWERGDVDIFRDGWGDGASVKGRGLSAGKDHEIRFVDDDGLVRVFVDGVERWETRGHLRGTVTIYPAVGSTIRIREVKIVGTPVPWIVVDGPSQRAP